MLLRVEASSVVGKGTQLDVLAWIATALLGVILLPAGLLKLTQSRQALVAKGQKWAADYPAGAVRAIGALEVLAVIGLIVPPLIDVAPSLAVAAAVGVVALMIGAAVTHARRRETALIAMNAVIIVLAVLVVIARVA